MQRLEKKTFNILSEIEAAACLHLIRIQMFEDIQCDSSEIPDSSYPYNLICIQIVQIVDFVKRLPVEIR